MAKADRDRALYIQPEQVAAIVLGGGRGSRLWPLTAERAKPAVPLGGRYRLVDIPLSNCIHSQMNRIFVLTQFLSASLIRHINNAYKFDAFSQGFVEILAAEQTDMAEEHWYQGTADAIRKAVRHLRNAGAKHFVILAGDHLYRMDYREMLATHVRERADVTVATLPVNRNDAQGFGILKVANNGRIREFVEKPKEKKQLDSLTFPNEAFDRFGLKRKKGQDYLASMGVYVFKADLLFDVLHSRPEWIDFGQHVIPGLIGSHRIFAHPFVGYWQDIGTVRSYFDSNLALASPNPPFEFHEESQRIFTNSRYLPGSRINGATIKDAVVCEGCRIKSGSTITRSIIGIRMAIQQDVEISDTVMLGADYYEEKARPKHPIGIGRGSKISRAIIDKNARIGKNVIIRGSKRLADREGPGYAIREGIVIVTKGAVIPDGTVIG